ncbi:hypothetical protein DFH08DRAFT_802387 [Mycena albidolilacea]|uniref:Uncharacterized protein n=1 Tax=Mycena albidolilacea TaxID=1033008 RepID=A0AAD7EZN2_9AGAR|nr:hypothetical protein DFH08DRAFT_802387 [Mycena albidolilacea]
MSDFPIWGGCQRGLCLIVNNRSPLALTGRGEVRALKFGMLPSMISTLSSTSRHLTQLSKDLESMSKNWSSSKFNRYLKSHNIREEIALFTRRVADLRANATLIAATGTRLDLAGVATGVAAVESRINDLQSQLVGQSLDMTAADNRELTRKFRALKLGDIHLEFRSARGSEFSESDHEGREKRRIGWTDYKATFHGCVRTVQLSALAAAIWFLQFSRTKISRFPRSEEYRSLDEYGNALPSAQTIVDWELNLYHRHFAIINVQDGKLVLSYSNKDTTRFHFGVRPLFCAYLRNTQCNAQYPPFLSWLVFDMDSWFSKPFLSAGFEGNLRETLGSLVTLQQKLYAELFDSTFETSFCRGCIRHPNARSPVAQLEGRVVTSEDSWRVCRATLGANIFEGACFPTESVESRDGFTHFVVPLVGKTRKWISYIDGKGRCGYFLIAEVEFGKSVPDITLGWMAQAASVRSELSQYSHKWDPSKFYVPIYGSLKLQREMTVPIVPEKHAEGPQIYWSTNAHVHETGSIPPAGFTIKMCWLMACVGSVAEAALKRHGFDPTINAAAKSLNLLPLAPVEPSNRRGCGGFPFVSWQIALGSSYVGRSGDDEAARVAHQSVVPSQSASLDAPLSSSNLTEAAELQAVFVIDARANRIKLCSLRYSSTSLCKEIEGGQDEKRLQQREVEMHLVSKSGAGGGGPKFKFYGTTGLIPKRGRSAFEIPASYSSLTKNNQPAIVRDSWNGATVRGGEEAGALLEPDGGFEGCAYTFLDRALPVVLRGRGAAAFSRFTHFPGYPYCVENAVAGRGAGARVAVFGARPCEYSLSDADEPCGEEEPCLAFLAVHHRDQNNRELKEKCSRDEAVRPPGVACLVQITSQASACRRRVAPDLMSESNSPGTVESGAASLSLGSTSHPGESGMRKKSTCATKPVFDPEFSLRDYDRGKLDVVGKRIPQY